MTHKGLAPPRVYPVFIASIDLTLLCNRVYFPRPTCQIGSRSGDNACVKMSVIQKSDQVCPPGRDH
jgi:hypothetical protein